MIPCYSTSLMSGPCIVKVLPDDVYPQAKMVPLKPSRTESIMGLAAASYTSFCDAFESKTESKVNLFYPNYPDCSFDMIKVKFLLFLSKSRQHLLPFSISDLFIGLTLHTTSTFPLVFCRLLFFCSSVAFFDPLGLCRFSIVSNEFLSFPRSS